jgi:L-lactate utilization protein LutB
MFFLRDRFFAPINFLYLVKNFSIPIILYQHMSVNYALFPLDFERKKVIIGIADIKSEERFDMDSNLAAIINKRINKTLSQLERNRMEAYFASDSEKAREIVSRLLNEGDVIGNGGSASLNESGVMELVKSGKYDYLDRDRPGITAEERNEIFRKSFFADAYVTSVNAITEDGELYCVDGNGNRAAAMVYGPKSVIVVAGYNKIVKDVKEAVERVRETAAPANATRLHVNVPCVETGHCMDCRSEGRICCTYTLFGPQRLKGRIKVIIVGEELGY